MPNPRVLKAIFNCFDPKNVAPEEIEKSAKIAKAIGGYGKILAVIALVGFLYGSLGWITYLRPSVEVVSPENVSTDAFAGRLGEINLTGYLHVANPIRLLLPNILGSRFEDDQLYFYRISEGIEIGDGEEEVYLLGPTPNDEDPHNVDGWSYLFGAPTDPASSPVVAVWAKTYERYGFSESIVLEMRRQGLDVSQSSFILEAVTDRRRDYLVDRKLEGYRFLAYILGGLGILIWLVSFMAVGTVENYHKTKGDG